MANTTASKPPNKPRLIAAAWSLIAGRILLSLALGIASVVLVAWPMGWISLRSLIDGLPTMKFNTALGLTLLAAIGLLRSRMRHFEHRPNWIVLSVALFVLLLALTSMLDSFFNWNLGVNTLLTDDPRSVARHLSPGLMSTGTAMGLFLLALSQLVSGFVPSWTRKAIALTAGLLGLVSISLFLMRSGVPGTSIFATTAIHTAMLLTFISAGYFFVWRGTKFIRSPEDRRVVFAEFHRARAITAVIVGMLAVGLTVTAILALDAQQTLQNVSAARFQYFNNLTVEDIERSINRVAYGLRSLRGLYYGSDKVSQEEFAAFIRSRDLPEEFPGTIGYGLIERVKREELPDYIETVQREDSPEFQVLTTGNASDLYIIRRIHPLERNRSAWGYDVGSEETRRSAAEKAVYTGEATITGRIELLQDKEKTSGFLYYLPFYESDEQLPPLEDRMAHLQGLVYAPIILEKTLKGIDQRTLGNVEIVIYDIEDGLPGTKLYGNRTADELDLEFPPETRPQFFLQQNIVAGGRHWQITTFSTRQFEQMVDRVTPTLIGVGGITLTLLLVGVIWSMGRSMALAHNLTVELQASEEKAKEARHVAEKANRAKSDFLANMSHEIRTPMNAIIGLTDSVLRTDLNRDQRDYLVTVSESSNTLLQIINDILDFSKIEAGKLELDEEEFHPHDVVAQALKSVASKLPHQDVELVYHVHRDVPVTLIGDSRRLGQILLNLVGNSIKFTHSGSIEVRVGMTGKADSKSDLVEIEFSVHDTGIGIPSDKLESIFNVFEQGDSSVTRRYGGTGLGLAISSRLVHKLGGQITVESSEGHGSTFRFSARFRRPHNASDSPWENFSSDLRGKRALVVDDNPIDLLLLKELTEAYHLEVTEADGGEAALQELETANQKGAPFDIVISDLKMPNMDGNELFQAIRKAPQSYGSPVGILVSSAGIDSQEESPQLPVALRIRKPVKPSEFLEAIVTGLGGETSIDAIVSPIGTEEEADSSRPPLRILLAEDSLANQKVALAILQRHHHDVTIVQNGLEAIEAVQKKNYDLLLMDVQMPVLDGLSAALQIREQESATGQHIPMVAITAHALKQDRARCLSAGMDDYVSKPLSPAELFNAIERALKKQQAQPEGSSLATAPPPNIRSNEPTPDSLVPWEKLLTRLGQDHQALTEIVEAYIPEMKQSLENIYSAIDQHDSHLLTISGHKLKSALRFFHQMEAATLAEDLERRGTQDDFDSVDDVVASLEEKLQELLPCLSDFLAA